MRKIKACDYTAENCYAAKPPVRHFCASLLAASVASDRAKGGEHQSRLRKDQVPACVVVRNSDIHNTGAEGNSNEPHNAKDASSRGSRMEPRRNSPRKGEGKMEGSPL